MMRLLKKVARRPGVPAEPRVSGRDLDNSSPADLRQVISELENEIAEHEATNAFLRELLTEQWFAAERELERL